MFHPERKSSVNIPFAPSLVPALFEQAHAGIMSSPHVLIAAIPPKKTTTEVRTLRLPSMFSGEKISSRTKRENADSFGSWIARRGGGTPKGEAPAGARRDMMVSWRIRRRGGGDEGGDL